ncbi:MAG TPA: YbhB/YbcL family Raf kinase inhibitor-like protein [Deltaproteobacteria bacterium]|nr:YbhB/YbcL family Raf kinase inhibitor-like protein [Deltaproteobacteria bacterium]
MRHLTIFLCSIVIFSLSIIPAPSNGQEKIVKLEVSSTAFKENTSIPKKYTCDGKDINPPLTIENVPQGTKSLALIVDDPDAPMGIWVHWVLWNIDPKTREIKENSVPQGAIQGINDFGKSSYGGPCPPSGTHRYFFKAYALDTVLNLPQNSRKADLEKGMKGHILGQGQLMGIYKKGIF